MKHNTMHYIFNILIFMLSVILPSCTHKKDIAKETLHIPVNKKDTSISITEIDITPPPITIWVHGTILFYKSFYQKIFNQQLVLFPAANLPSDHYFHQVAKTISHHD